ncbi:plasmid maintenance system antidote protein like protein [Ralstonia phage phiRSL1]|uniref:Plasmid maintenance system antidote protein like protein n=1 Tax=Ralstonia phage phiRSL1 TaxID=1980924 RepID=B2ZXX1_9CAUD|nr:plasmid maintenance system antidote protein like protein [Ralstonia phage phiRSL1]BAG41547.1 plasmid maintenance system antidote protein like protein [Ralstonia phage phiRSL1]
MLTEKAPITADLALRIEHWLGIMHGGRARMWLEMQMDYDLQVAQASPPTGVLKAPV